MPYTVLFLVVFAVGVYFVPNVIGAALYYGGGLVIKALGFSIHYVGVLISSAIKFIVYSVLFMLPDWFTGTMMYVWPIISAVGVYMGARKSTSWVERLLLFIAFTVIGILLSIAMVPGQFAINGWLSLILRVLAPFADEFNWAAMAAIVASFQLTSRFTKQDGYLGKKNTTIFVFACLMTLTCLAHDGDGDGDFDLSDLGQTLTKFADVDETTADSEGIALMGMATLPVSPPVNSDWSRLLDLAAPRTAAIQHYTSWSKEGKPDFMTFVTSVVFVPHLYSYTRVDEENQSDGAGDFNLRADAFQSYTWKGIALVQMMSYVLSISCILFLADLMLGSIAEREMVAAKAARKVVKKAQKVEKMANDIQDLLSVGSVTEFVIKVLVSVAKAVFKVLSLEIALRLLSRWTIKWFASHNITIGLSAMLVAWELSGAVNAVHKTFWKLPVALVKTVFSMFSKMVGGDDKKKRTQ